MEQLRCFLSVAALFLWINRPILMRFARSLDTFKRQLNTVVLRRFFLTPLGLLRDPGGLKGRGRLRSPGKNIKTKIAHHKAAKLLHKMMHSESSDDNGK